MSDLIKKESAAGVCCCLHPEECYDEIMALKPVDAVEVVRCKDCKWYEYMRDVCHNPRYGDGHANYCPPCVKEDYFCKDGERTEP